jgi:hypothetical protein
MRASSRAGFNPAAPLQTIPGTAEALRCSKTKVYELLHQGRLEKAMVDRAARVTTASIFSLIAASTETEAA